MRRVGLIGLFMLAMIMPATVHAQTVVNPTSFTFDHTDFAGTTDYEFGYFSSSTATVPVQSGIFPKPATCQPCSGTLPSRPSAFQSWWVAVQARAGTVVSGWSASVPFVLRPSVPTNLILK